MIKRYFATKDATLYQVAPVQNTGIDEILELKHVVSASSNNLSLNTRILMKFDLTDISQSMASGKITNPEFYLNLRTIEAKEIGAEYTLYAHPVSQSWETGIGSYNDDPYTRNGVSWLYRTGEDTGNAWKTGSYANGSTGYYAGQAGGGTWYYYNTKTINSISSASVSISTKRTGVIVSASDGGSTTNCNCQANIPTITTQSVVSSTGYSSASYRPYTFADGGTYQITGSVKAQIRITDNPNYGDITGSYIYYLFATGSTKTHTTSSLFVSMSSLSDGSHILVNDLSSRYTFIATDAPVPGDVPSAKIYYFLSSSIQTLVTKINTNVSAISASYNSGSQVLKLYSNESGSRRNNYRFTFNSTSSYFTGGTDSQFSASVSRLVDKINEIKSTTNISASWAYPYINLTATIEGSGSSGYVLRYGNTSSSLFQGGITTSSISGSMSYQTDSPSTGDYYYQTGSNLYESVNNIASKLNSIYNDIVFSQPATGTLKATTVSASINSSLFTLSGSSFSPATASFYELHISASQDFSYTTTDVKMNVTNIVHGWISGSMPNDGFIIKRSNQDEASATPQGHIKFFSTETHTIYAPTLDVYWDDSVWDTGSLTELTSDDKIVYPKSMRREYRAGSYDKIRIYARDRFPRKTFATGSAYRVNYTLPSSSYYQIVDSETEDIIIPFDTKYTKLSSDPISNYINVDFNSFLPERFYKLEIKTVNGTHVEYYDDGFYFKVVR